MSHKASVIDINSMKLNNYSLLPTREFDGLRIWLGFKRNLTNIIGVNMRSFRIIHMILNGIKNVKINGDLRAILIKKIVRKINISTSPTRRKMSRLRGRRLNGSLIIIISTITLEWINLGVIDWTKLSWLSEIVSLFWKKNIFIKANISRNEICLALRSNYLIFITWRYMKKTIAIALGLNLCLWEERVEA